MNFKKLFLYLSFSTFIIFTSCIALFDSSNFGDVKKLKKVMLDETWTVGYMHIFDGERSSRDEPFNTVRDSIIATSGTMRFEKESEKGVRAMTYTDASGQALEASFIIDSDVNDDNPVITFVDLENLFPEPYLEAKYKVLSFSKSEIELFMEFYGNGDLTKQECTITLVK